MAEGVVEMQVDYKSWWYSSLQQLLYDNPFKFSYTYLRSGKQVTDGYSWHNEVKQLLARSSRQGMQVTDGYWWYNEVKQLLAGSSMQVAGKQVTEDELQWWYRQVKKLLETFGLLEMCQFLLKMFKAHLVSFERPEQLLTYIEGVIVPNDILYQIGRNLESVTEIKESLERLKRAVQEQLEIILDSSIEKILEVVFENSLSEVLENAANMLISLKLLSETCISLEIPENHRESWYQVLQEAAYRQLVSVERWQRFLGAFIGELRMELFEDWDNAQQFAAENRLVSVGELPLPSDTFLQQVAKMQEGGTYKAWKLQAKRQLAPVKRVQQMLETFISQETLVNEYSWSQVLKVEFEKLEFKELHKLIIDERIQVFPPADLVFSWTKFCRIKDVKVVILGQDPYSRPGEAHGLCFSVPYGKSPPISLKNIYKVLETDKDIYTLLKKDNRVEFKSPEHGTLIGWAIQGVLLLNSCLTFRADEKGKNAHIRQGWENLTDAVISWLNNNLNHIVFMLWGVHAEKRRVYIDETKHKVLSSSHPSSLSAYLGFSTTKDFSECNIYLHGKKKAPIDWFWLPAIQPYRCNVSFYKMCN